MSKQNPRWRLNAASGILEHFKHPRFRGRLVEVDEDELPIRAEDDSVDLLSGVTLSLGERYIVG